MLVCAAIQVVQTETYSADSTNSAVAKKILLTKIQPRVLLNHRRELVRLNLVNVLIFNRVRGTWSVPRRIHLGVFNAPTIPIAIQVSRLALIVILTSMAVLRSKNKNGVNLWLWAGQTSVRSRVTQTIKKVGQQDVLDFGTVCLTRHRAFKMLTAMDWNVSVKTPAKILQFLDNACAVWVVRSLRPARKATHSFQMRWNDLAVSS